jgi:hypothetical protein
MQKLKQLYRSDYSGETMTTSSTWAGSKWEYTQEFVPNAISNQQTSRRAVVIGNGLSRKNYELQLLKNHRAGILGSLAAQTYGCNALYREFTPTFLVSTGTEISKEIAESDFCQDNIVYANAEIVATYPQKFYLIPQDIHYDAGALAVYLACFDGHKNIYLLGFDNWSGDGDNSNMYLDTNGYGSANQEPAHRFWTNTLTHIMQTYSEVNFTRVMPTPGWWSPDAWKNCLNYKQISYKEFVLEIDL